MLVMLCLASPAALFAMGTAGQRPSGDTAAVTSAPTATVKSSTRIKDIVNDPARFLNARVELSGTFRGWKSSCPASFMLTRSDWVVEDETGCIYVTGILPSELAPAQPRGERIVISGTIMRGGNGKPVLKAEGITRIKE